MGRGGGTMEEIAMEEMARNLHEAATAARDAIDASREAEEDSEEEEEVEEAGKAVAAECFNMLKRLREWQGGEKQDELESTSRRGSGEIYEVADVVQGIVEDALDTAAAAMEEWESRNHAEGNGPKSHKKEFVNISLLLQGKQRPQDLFEEKPNNEDAPWQPPEPHPDYFRAPPSSNCSEGPRGDPSTSSQAVKSSNLPAAVLAALAFCEEDIISSSSSHVSSPPSPPSPPAPSSLSTVPFVYVDTPAALAAMVADLKGVEEVAVDLEHHGFRTYMGLTCVLQLSSREKDWVVDTLALRAHIGPALGGLFGNPRVVKVLHGSNHDLLWLQRDFGIYILNLFDTGQAARVLQLESCSLAHCLKYCCRINAEKRFQLADWRIRPLTREMLEYARMDTHYLLFIADRLRYELKMAEPVVIDEAGTRVCALRETSRRSHALCYTIYQRSQMNASFIEKVKRSAQLRGRRWSGEQHSVLDALIRWRDALGRRLDESNAYILPVGTMAQLAAMLPTTAKSVRIICSGRAEAAASRAAELALVIEEAKKESADRPLGGNLTIPSAVHVDSSGLKAPALNTRVVFSPDEEEEGGGGTDKKGEERAKTTLEESGQASPPLPPPPPPPPPLVVARKTKGSFSKPSNKIKKTLKNSISMLAEKSDLENSEKEVRVAPLPIVKRAASGTTSFKRQKNSIDDVSCSAHHRRVMESISAKELPFDLEEVAAPFVKVDDSVGKIKEGNSLAVEAAAVEAQRPMDDDGIDGQEEGAAPAPSKHNIVEKSLLETYGVGGSAKGIRGHPVKKAKNKKKKRKAQQDGGNDEALGSKKVKSAFTTPEPREEEPGKSAAKAAWALLAGGSQERKGGGRSHAFPRSGNRSSTFRL